MSLEDDPLVQAAIKMFDGKLVSDEITPPMPNASPSTSGSASSDSMPSRGSSTPRSGTLAEDTAILDEFIAMLPRPR